MYCSLRKRKGASYIEIIFLVLLLAFITFLFVALFRHWDISLDEKVKNAFDTVMAKAQEKFGVVF